mgnify:CR=1 FL=1
MPVPFSRLQSEALDSYGTKEAFDNLAKYDGIVAFLGNKGMIQFESGGQPNFRERTLHGYNTTIGHRSKNAPITQTDDEGFTLISVDQALIDGSIVYNQQELDQVQGEPSLAPSLIRDKIVQFNTTWVQRIANGLRVAVPAATGPFSLLPSGTTGVVRGWLIARTPAQQVSDAATTAGILRSETATLDTGETVNWWANQYSTTSRDLTTVAGRAGLYGDIYAPATRGASREFEPDFGLCGSLILANLGAVADNNRRGVTSSDESMAKFGYDTIKFYNATLIRDASTRFVTSATRHSLALLNSRTIKLKVLKGAGGVTQEMLDERNNLKSLPIFWKHKNMSDFASLNYNWVGYLTYQFMFKSLQDNGLHDNLV